jgi:hypothetical protein
MKQSLALFTYERKNKRTKREIFLNEMKRVIPRERLEALIEQHYPNVGKDRPPRGLKWCCEFIACSNGKVCLTRELRRFAELELGEVVFPDENSIPEMSSTKNSSNWPFGMKELPSALMLTRSLTSIRDHQTASTQDNSVFGELIREVNRVVFGDKDYACDHPKRAAQQKRVSTGRAGSLFWLGACRLNHYFSVWHSHQRY